MPERLAERLEEMAREMERAYSEGRLELPTQYCERVPIWLVVQSAVSEQEARRERSRKPRRSKAPTGPATADPVVTEFEVPE